MRKSPRRNNRQNRQRVDELQLRREYDAALMRHAQLAQSVRAISEAALTAEGIPYHSVKARVKSCSSILEKIRRKGYAPTFASVTDIVGVRVVCLYARHVDQVAAKLKKEFEPVEVVDKRPDSLPDRFGYSSLHMICRLRSARLTLAEYKPFEHAIFEIQIRTILQEAWAEIEHRLVYKGDNKTPPSIKRAIARTAANLETADIAFDEVFARHSEYQLTLRSTNDAGLRKQPLNAATLMEFIRRKFSWAGNWEAEHGPGLVAELKLLIKELDAHGISDIEQLTALVNKTKRRADAINKRAYRIAAGKQKPVSADDEDYVDLTQNDAWNHRSKRYYWPIGELRLSMELEFPDYKRPIDDE